MVEGETLPVNNGYSKDMLKMLGITPELHEKMETVAQKFPEYSDFFSARFMASHFDQNQMKVLVGLGKSKGMVDVDYANNTGDNLVEIRRSLGKLFDEGMVNVTRKNKGGWFTHYWFKDENGIRYNIQKEKQIIEEKLEKDYQRLQGTFYQCRGCSSTYRFEDIAQRDRCGCGSPDFVQIEQHPQKQLVADTLKTFFGVVIQ